MHKSEKTTSVSSDPPKNNNKETNKQLNYKNKKQNKKELEFKKHLNHSFFPNTSRKRKRMQALLWEMLLMVVYWIALIPWSALIKHKLACWTTLKTAERFNANTKVFNLGGKFAGLCTALQRNTSMAALRAFKCKRVLSLFGLFSQNPHRKETVYSFKRHGGHIQPLIPSRRF